MINNKLVVIKHKRKLIGVVFNQNNNLLNNENYVVYSLPVTCKECDLYDIAAHIDALMCKLKCSKLALQTNITCEDKSSLTKALKETGVDFTCVYNKVANKYSPAVARILTQTNFAYNIPYEIPEGVMPGSAEARYFRTAKIVLSLSEDVGKMELFLEKELMSYRPVVYLGGKLRLDTDSIYKNALYIFGNTLNGVYGRIYAPDVIDREMHPLVYRVIKLLRVHFKDDRIAILNSIRPWIASGYTLSDYLKSLNNFDSSVICELTLGVFSPPIDMITVDLEVNEDAIRRIENYYNSERDVQSKRTVDGFIEQGITSDDAYKKLVKVGKERCGEAHTEFLTSYAVSAKDGTVTPVCVIIPDNDENTNNN